MASTNPWLTNGGITPFPYAMTPMNNITPLTYRDGITYLKMLETLQYWLEKSVIPGFEGIMDNAFQDYLKGLENAENTVIKENDKWKLLFESFISNFQNEIKALNDVAISELLKNDESASYDAVMELVNNAISSLSLILNNEISSLSLILNNKIDGEITEITNLLTNMETAYKAADDKKINNSEKAKANGVATLNSFGKVDVSQLNESTLIGNFSTRPLPASVNVGTTFYSSDTVETYRSNGTVWVRVGRGGFLGSATIVTRFETTSTTLVDVTGMAVTFVAGSGSTKFTISGECFNTVSNGVVILALFIDGTDVGHISVQTSIQTKVYFFNRTFERTNLIPGNTYTAKVRMTASTTGGYAQLDASSANPCSLIVEAQ